MKRVCILAIAACGAVLCVIVISLRGRETPIEKDEYPRSPLVNVLLAEEAKEAVMTVDCKELNIYVEGKAKALRWKGERFSISRRDGCFLYAGMSQNAGWLDLVPEDSRFGYGNGRYPGSLRVVARGPHTMCLVNVVELEPYVARVVQAEMNRDWPMETLKAQAIVARTFALFHATRREERPWHLYGTSRSLAYSKREPNERVIRAVKDTLSLVLTWKNGLFPACFISTCGGRTDRASITFAEVRDTAPLQGVLCPHCTGSPFYKWKVAIGEVDLKKVLSPWCKEAPVHALRITREEKDRVLELELESPKGSMKKIGAQEFRKAVNRWAGREVARSLKFSLLMKDGTLYIEGNGWGWHGAGMCQYGARTMGEQCRTCRNILDFYFPGAKLASGYVSAPERKAAE